MFTSLACGKHFSKIDLRQAYLQMEMHNESKPLLTLNTQGTLPAEPPRLWSRICTCNVAARHESAAARHPTRPVHHRRLYHHRRDGRRAPRQPRSCMYSSACSTPDCECTRPRPASLMPRENTAATRSVPLAFTSYRPKSMPSRKHRAQQTVAELRSFLGLVSYYRMFIPDVATTLHPLNALLQRGKRWKWTPDCERAFQTIKQQMASDTILTHFNSNLPIRVASNASPYGLGAVLSYVMPSGEKRPIAFASLTLAQAQRNYNQIDKEALGIVCSLRKFHSYVYA